MKRAVVLSAAALLGVVFASNASPGGLDTAPCGLAAPASSSGQPAPAVSYPAPPASDVTPGSATIEGFVDAAGETAEVAFEYGISSDYGTCTSVEALAGSGSQAVSATITGLAPGTTYHFRLDATSSAGTTLGQDETFTTSVPAPSPVRIARGVHVGGVSVGGLTRQAAMRAVSAAYDAPLEFSYGGRHWRATPEQLRARADVDAAVQKALAAGAGTEVPVRVSLDTGRIGRYVANLGALFGRQARAGSVRLVGRHAVVTRGEPGVVVESVAMTAAIGHALQISPRPVVRLLVRRIEPPRPGKKAVVIRLGEQTLTAYVDGNPVLTTPVTTGRPALPTPVGSYTIHFRASPYTFISPWPQGSPFYYSPTTVTWAMYFYDNDFLHDDPGQPDGTYGKGSNLGPYASHGCVHVPHDTMRFLYTWLPIGATVIVASS